MQLLLDAQMANDDQSSSHRADYSMEINSTALSKKLTNQVCVNPFQKPIQLFTNCFLYFVFAYFASLQQGSQNESGDVHAGRLRDDEHYTQLCIVRFSALS